MMLSERLRPKNISELVGNEQARLELVKWLKNWNLGSKAILLTGPPGVGKSTAVHAVAREFGYTLVEYNASDVRTREKLRTSLGPVLANSSIFGDKEKMMIFLDEVDGLSGRSDYAGSEFILDFIENSRIPVAMAANVEDDPKLKKLEQKSIVLRFKPIDDQMLFVYLKAASKREHIPIGEENLRHIASNSRGDVRFALNLLQSLAGEESANVRTDKQFFSDAQAIDAVLAAGSLVEVSALLRQFDATPYDKIRAIFDSIVSAKTLSLEDKSKALDLVSDADILLTRINREQNWRLLRYFDRYLGIATLGKNLKRSDSSVPWNLKLAIWNDGRVIRSLQERFSGVYHVDKSDFSDFYLPYFSFYFKNNPKELEGFIARYELSDSDRRILLKLAK